MLKYVHCALKRQIRWNFSILYNWVKLCHPVNLLLLRTTVKNLRFDKSHLTNHQRPKSRLWPNSLILCSRTLLSIFLLICCEIWRNWKNMLSKIMHFFVCRRLCDASFFSSCTYAHLPQRARSVKKTLTLRQCSAASIYCVLFRWENML